MKSFINVEARASRASGIVQKQRPSSSERPLLEASMGGLEPPTPAFGGQCSIQLSYMDRSVRAREGGHPPGSDRGVYSLPRASSSIR